MTGILNYMFVAVLAVAVALIGPGVSGQTHHMVGDDGGLRPGLDMGSWLSGRVFRVGDKISFSYPAATEEGIVEVQSLNEFLSCDVANPIKMYTDDHVTLDKEGVRYFTSRNPENCKNGLKLPINTIQPPLPFSPPYIPDHSPPTFEPPHPFYPPFVPSHPPPSPHVPSHPPPSPPPSPPPHVPSHPPPAFVPPPPQPPSGSTHLDGISVVLFAMLVIGLHGNLIASC